jgi:hypothetical protein
VVVVVVVASAAPTVVVMAGVVVVVAVDAFRSSSGFYGIPSVAVRSETTLDRRCRGRDPTSVSLLLRRRRVRAAGGWCFNSSVLRVLARGGAFRLLHRRSLEQRLQLLAYSSLLRGCWLRAAAQQHGRGGQVLGRPTEKWRYVGASVDVRTFVGALVVVGLWCARRWCRCTAVRLTCGRTTFSLVVVRVAGLALNRDVPREAPVAVSLHGHALRRLSITRLGINAEFLMQKDQLLIELAPCLR